MNAPCSLRRTDEVCRLLHRRRHGFFAQHMASVRKRDFDDGMTGGGNDHVEHDVGASRAQHRREIGSDRDVLKRKLDGQCLRNRGVEIDQTYDGQRLPQLGRGLKRAQPPFGHGSAPTQNHLVCHRLPPKQCLRGDTSLTSVNVYGTMNMSIFLSIVTPKTITTVYRL